MPTRLLTNSSQPRSGVAAARELLHVAYNLANGRSCHSYAIEVKFDPDVFEDYPYFYISQRVLSAGGRAATNTFHKLHAGLSLLVLRTETVRTTIFLHSDHADERILLKSDGVGIGIGLGLALAVAYHVWYCSRPMPPKPWDTSATTANFVNADTSGDDNHFEFRYILETTLSGIIEFPLTRS